MLIFLGPFALPPSNPSPPFPHDHDLYMLALTKYNTFCPKTYVIKVINVIIAYTTIGLCHSLWVKFVIRTCVTKLMSWKCHMSLIISQAKVCHMGLGVLCHSTYVNQVCSITKVDVTWVVINLYMSLGFVWVWPILLSSMSFKTWSLSQGQH